MGWFLGVHSYWTEGQWGIVDLTVESTVGEFYVIYDVLSPMACVIDGLRRLSPYRTIGSCLDQLFDPQRSVTIEFVADYRLVMTKGYENQ